MEIITRDSCVRTNKNCGMQIDVGSAYVHCNHVAASRRRRRRWGGYARCTSTTYTKGAGRSTRVPYTAVICCWWVKLFNPAGINHSRHVRNLCTGAAPGCATRRATRNIRARPSGRTVSHVVSRRIASTVPGVPRRLREFAGNDSENSVSLLFPAIYGTRYSEIARVAFSFFLSLFFFTGERR